MTATTAQWASRYIDRLGMALTWTPKGAKGPRHSGWNLESNAITTPAAALKFWSLHPDHGVGVLLAFSRLVSLDIDDVEHSRMIFGHFGIELGELRARAPCVIGNPAKFRLIYRAPADVELKHRTVIWPKPNALNQGFAVFELRAGAISDALPPSIHAGTGAPYRWETAPIAGFPPLPPELLALWLDWPAFNRRALALCPWAPMPAAQPSPRSELPRRTGESVIDVFNSAHDTAAILEAHGYQRRGKRFASPETDHAAGIVLLDDGRVFCHHAGDPLSGEHAHDAFDVYRLLQHGGDFRAAVRAAAHALGLNEGAR